MLSRIADSLYWMSRYLERAGNTARLVEINLLHLLEAEDALPEAAQRQHFLSLYRVDRRVEGSQDKRTADADSLNRLIEDTLGKRLNVNRHVGKFGHGR